MEFFNENSETLWITKKSFGVVFKERLGYAGISWRKGVCYYEIEEEDGSWHDLFRPWTSSKKDAILLMLEKSAR